jgi:ectoine hydroxylase-related dioxygenase (phytanoyl-CoA dioxygenase family)
LRFYFPGFTLDGYRSPDGLALSHHCDIMFGDPFEEINCWMPLGRCKATNSLQLHSQGLSHSVSLLRKFAETIDFDFSRFWESRDLFFLYLCSNTEFRSEVLASCRPMEMHYGEVLLFDPRLIHGTLDNEENETRVSIDFRLLPLSAYWAERARGPRHPRGGSRRLRGHYWHALSAFELAANF